MIEVLTISTSGIPCGIAEYFAHLRSASPSDLHFRCDPAWLDPEVFFAQLPSMEEYQGPQVVWLNYHAALHSRWTSGKIARLRAFFPIVTTFHDTGIPNSDQCLRTYESTVTLLDDVLKPGAFIIHEPCVDLPGAIYLRQGIPRWQAPYTLDLRTLTDPSTEYGTPAYNLVGRNRRPVLGTVGFPFPWKRYDLLAEATALAGWSLLLFAPNATDEQVTHWRQLNPWTAVNRGFIEAAEVVRGLAACDATAFLYQCANTGTSGAIRQGIAARKPVLATAGCRQFRDLELDLLGQRAITFLPDLSPEGVAEQLEAVRIGRLDPAVHRLAERDSWTHQAARYADIFRAVARV
jgi:glycosyltransferase involved in cell wall biosynthesis